MGRVGCAGILVADMFCGPVPALPEPGELLAVDDMRQSAGGCAANVAIGLALQGLSVEVSGCVGNDASAEILYRELGEAGVGCAHLVRSDTAPTSKTVILLAEGADRRYLHAFGANGVFRVADIDPAWALGLDVFYVGGLFALPAFALDDLAALLKACRAAGVVTVVDVVVPRDRDVAGAMDALLPHIDYFLPNEDEARALTGAADPLEQIRRLQEAGARTVIVTRGPGGSLAARDGRLFQADAHRFDALDPSGSGDAFTAGIITGIVRGYDLPAMLRLGAALGASAARAVGTTTSVFRGDEAERFLADHPIEVKEIPWK